MHRPEALGRYPRAAHAVKVALRLSALVFCILAASANASFAGDYSLAPLTKLRIKAFQLNPAKGEFVQWDAISGEYVVSAEGTLSIPLAGTIDAANLDVVKLPAVLASALQKKVNLVSAPDISIEVVEYPPIYVSGQVTNPGEYRYRPAITVLQAVALSGGRYRPIVAAGSLDQFSLVSDLKNVKTSILRSKARIARLQAEIADAPSIVFPDELKNTQDNAVVAEIIEQENLLFTTRRSGLERQMKTLSELQKLYGAEIDNLKEKGMALDSSIAAAEEELGRITQLVEKGIVTTPQKIVLERDLTNMRSGRLDIATTLMRAQQSLAESTRSAEALRDQEATRAATELQDAKVGLDQLKTRQSVSENLLGGGSSDQSGADQQQFTYAIIRHNGDKTEELPAKEDTPLLPGDVLKVSSGSAE